MKLLTIDQITEINSTYCAIIVKIFKQISFKKLVIANFLLKYPSLLRNLNDDINLTDFELNNFNSFKDNISYHDSWDKVTLDAIRILVAKNLVIFDSNYDMIINETEKTSKFYMKISKFEEFEAVIERVKFMKLFFKNNDIEELKRLINYEI